MGGAPEGFSFAVHGGQVVISHAGRHAMTLRGATAERFLRDVEAQDAQQLMARMTGNYRRGNERLARSHPRNAGGRR